MSSLALSAFGLYLSSASTAAPRVDPRFRIFASSLAVAPKPARRSRWRASVAVSTVAAFPIVVFPGSVGAVDPAVDGRTRRDPAPDHVDEPVVELRPVERHALAEPGSEIAGERVDEVARLGIAVRRVVDGDTPPAGGGCVGIRR